MDRAPPYFSFLISAKKGPDSPLFPASVETPSTLSLASAENPKGERESPAPTLTPPQTLTRTRATKGGGAVAAGWEERERSEARLEREKEASAPQPVAAPPPEHHPWPIFGHHQGKTPPPLLDPMKTPFR